jgi:hypothetical protein
MAHLLLARISRLAEVGGVGERIGHWKGVRMENVFAGFEVPPGIEVGNLGGEKTDEEKRG